MMELFPTYWSPSNTILYLVLAPTVELDRLINIIIQGISFRQLFQATINIHFFIGNKATHKISSHNDCLIIYTIAKWRLKDRMRINHSKQPRFSSVPCKVASRRGREKRCHENWRNFISRITTAMYRIKIGMFPLISMPLRIVKLYLVLPLRRYWGV